jgi:hypothetical protein
MHRSSDTIGAIAAALAKAQAELTNPEKSLSGTIRSPFPREPERTFRYAPLSSGLDIVRKTLGRHKIAAVQSTDIDKDAGLIRLTTILAHSSGEWVSSEWPVCPIAETAAPHRMGAALTYARRYALFTLVGIAGEDDLDAPDLNTAPSDSGVMGGSGGHAADPNSPSIPAPLRRPNGKSPNSPLLAPDASAVLRDQLVAELAKIAEPEGAAAWAHKTLPTKNTLIEADARQVEDAFALRLQALGGGEGATSTTTSSQPGIGASTPDDPPEPDSPLPDWLGPADPEPFTIPAGVDKSALAIPALRRFRDKVHLAFVAAQPCLVCGRKPVDPHHVRFAQGRALGRKVSDEFTVPLCRSHHRELHRSGSEYLWWENVGIDPLKVARKLWKKTRSKHGPKIADQRHVAPKGIARTATGRMIPGAQAPSQAATQLSSTDLAASSETSGADRP